MAEELLDDLDRRILHLLQLDARQSATDIGEDVDVTSTTVKNRLDKLEDSGVVRGYHPDIDYEAAGYPLHVLFVCSAEASDLGTFSEYALNTRGVVSVRQMLAGEQNLHVEVVGPSVSDIEQMRDRLSELGLRIVSSNIIADTVVRPWNHFGSAEAENGFGEVQSAPDAPTEE